jgi:hypothetical protein
VVGSLITAPVRCCAGRGAHAGRKSHGRGLRVINGKASCAAAWCVLLVLGGAGVCLDFSSFLFPPVLSVRCAKYVVRTNLGLDLLYWAGKIVARRDQDSRCRQGGLKQPYPPPHTHTHPPTTHHQHPPRWPLPPGCLGGRPEPAPPSPAALLWHLPDSPQLLHVLKGESEGQELHTNRGTSSGHYSLPTRQGGAAREWGCYQVGPLRRRQLVHVQFHVVGRGVRPGGGDGRARTPTDGAGAGGG